MAIAACSQEHADKKEVLHALSDQQQQQDATTSYTSSASKVSRRRFINFLCDRRKFRSWCVIAVKQLPPSPPPRLSCRPQLQILWPAMGRACKTCTK